MRLQLKHTTILSGLEKSTVHFVADLAIPQKFAQEMVGVHFLG
jgi:hypothetical protein